MATKKPYHKEDLRGDLLGAGRVYVAENGHVGLSVRTLAQQVGVSPGAPYHHFPDRRTFLLALAVEGFKELMESSDLIANSDASGADKLKAMGVTFIRFADDNPRLMDLMYESELTSPTLAPELQQFQLIGYKALKKPITETLPDASEAEIELRGIAFWSAIYGFSTMRRKGVLHPSDDAIPSLDIVDSIIDRFVLTALAS